MENLFGHYYTLRPNLRDHCLSERLVRGKSFCRLLISQI